MKTITKAKTTTRDENTAAQMAKLQEEMKTLKKLFLSGN